MGEELESVIRVRMSAADAHYGGNLVDGARMTALFGDVATELLIKLDGDEGLFLRYDEVEFLAPVYAGDYIEARGKITEVGNTSRKMEFEARKVIAARPDVSPSAADFLPEPVTVARAKGICVTPKANKRQ
ncbi:MAG: 3-aminobutyryl-CoA ammonia lyase [Candidatus Geothermincolia bacterium]